MRVLGLCGSTRIASCSLALLRAMAGAAPKGWIVAVEAGLADLPVFSPDREGPPAPPGVEALLAAIAAADALVIASPEYVRTIPGGLKNGVDWCVSRPEILGKPIALAHASHRGDEMLGHLRRVLDTVSNRFTADVFLRVPLSALPPKAVAPALAAAGPEIASFWAALAAHVQAGNHRADFPVFPRNCA